MTAEPAKCVFLAAIITAFLALADDAASRNGQLISTQAQPEVCTQIYQPVCGTDKEGKRVTYSNACFARVANAGNLTPGECSK